MKLIYDVKTEQITIDNSSPNIQIDFNTLKQEKINELKLLTQQYIFQHYPDIKQKSDIADKEYYENLLKIHGIDEITFRKFLYQEVRNIFLNQSTFTQSVQNIITNIPSPLTLTSSEYQIAVEQLLKIALRTTFVQKVKEEYRQYLNQINQATTIDELRNIQIQFNTPFPL